MRVALAGLLLLVACKEAPSSSAPAPASASATPSPTPSVAPAPWFQGAWEGSYQATLHRVELPAGGVKEWKNDDGSQASGGGKLSLEAAPDGSVTGKATGALGELLLRGQVDGDRMTLVATPSDPAGFRGVMLVSRAADGLQGTLSASTGDSLSVREAPVTLQKVKR